MSFIKLVVCNESPQENKSSVWKMQILGNLAVKVGCQGKSQSLAVEAYTIFFKWGEPQESHGLNTVKFILLWC